MYEINIVRHEGHIGFMCNFPEYRGQVATISFNKSFYWTEDERGERYLSAEYLNINILVTSKELVGGEFTRRNNPRATNAKADTIELAFLKVKLLLHNLGWDTMNLELPEEV